MANDFSRPKTFDSNGQLDGSDSHSDEISLKPLFRTLWNYRRAMAVWASVIVMVFVLGTLYAYVFQPSERQASIEFEVLFDGADKGKYPNGLMFSQSDIISPPVLSAVYDANDLKRYFTFDEFKNRIFIFESNKDLELLELEYTGKLTDTRLTPVDRARLEAEFRQKQEALKVGRYRLTFLSPGFKIRVPDTLMSKLLNDILSTWAQQTADLKGVLSYQVQVYTPNVLVEDLIKGEDYIVRLDLMREKISRIITNVDELLELPGATLIRVGEKRISLPEIRANLVDIRDFRVQPLFAMARNTEATRDPSQLAQYLENRLNQTKLNYQEAVGRARTLQDGLNSYMQERGQASTTVREGGATSSQALPNSGTAMIPQLSESFLDRLIAISSQNGEIQYRQRLTEQIIKAGDVAVSAQKEAAYYEDLVNSIRRLPTGGRDRETSAAIDTKFNEIYSSVVRALEQIDAAYKELSKQNLNPRTTLYRTIGPYLITTERVITIRTVALYAVIMILSLLVVPLGCIIHHYFKKEILQQPKANSGDQSIEDEHIEPKARSVGAD